MCYALFILMPRPVALPEPLNHWITEAQAWTYQEPQKALDFARQARVLLTEQAPLDVQLEVRRCFVNCLSSAGENHEGLREAWELLALAVEAGDVHTEATADQLIATMLSSIGQYEQSLPYFQEARRLSESLDEEQFAIATLNLADTLEKLGRMTDAEHTYQSVLDLSAHHPQVQVVQSYARLSLVDVRVLEFEMAVLPVSALEPEVPVIRQVAEEARGARDRFLELYAHSLATRLLIHLNRLPEAEAHFAQSWAIAQELDQPTAWASAYEARAFLYCLQDDHTEAMQSFEEAARQLEQVGTNGELLQLLNSYVRYLRFWKQHEKAFEVLWKLHTLDRSVRTEGVILQAQMVALQGQIEVERKANELHVQHVQELQHLQKQLQEQNKLLEKLSREDELTGVFNRRHAVHLLREMGASTGCALLLFDVDHFKKVNDLFGHSMGDAVLKGIADIVRLHLQEGDVFGRLGGEEFVVALHSPCLIQAEKLAWRLCQAVSEARWTGMGDRNVTLSIGVTLFTSGTLEAALHIADEALYEAKGQGRNCVVVRQKN